MAFMITKKLGYLKNNRKYRIWLLLVKEWRNNIVVNELTFAGGANVYATQKSQATNGQSRYGTYQGYDGGIVF